MIANLSKPMNTEQAVAKHQCSQCADGDPCEHDCVLSETCSLRCVHCNERNWFTGDLPPARPWKFACLACGKPNERR